MPKAKPAVQVPGESDQGAADTESEVVDTADAEDDPAPPPRRRGKKAATPADPYAPASDEVLPPAIVRAIEHADRMSHKEAAELAKEGRLPNRVLTEQGWYVPNVKQEG